MFRPQLVNRCIKMKSNNYMPVRSEMYSINLCGAVSRICNNVLDLDVLSQLILHQD
jgi:hypothetical protein